MTENELSQREQDRQQQQEKINAATLAIVAALGPLDDEARNRVLEAANIMLGTKPPRVTR